MQFLNQKLNKWFSFNIKIIKTLKAKEEKFKKKRQTLVKVKLWPQIKSSTI